MAHFGLEGILGSDDLLGELHFLGFHVLVDVTFAVSEGFLDDLVDTFLDLVVLLTHHTQQLAVKHLELVVEVVDLVLDLLAQPIQSLGSLNSGRFKAGSIGFLVGYSYSCGEKAGLDGIVGSHGGGGVPIVDGSLVGVPDVSSLDTGGVGGSNWIVYSKLPVHTSCSPVGSGGCGGLVVSSGDLTLDLIVSSLGLVVSSLDIGVVVASRLVGGVDPIVVDSDIGNGGVVGGIVVGLVLLIGSWASVPFRLSIPGSAGHLAGR